MGDGGDKLGGPFAEPGPITGFQDLLADEAAARRHGDATGLDEIARRGRVDALPIRPASPVGRRRWPAMTPRRGCAAQILLVDGGNDSPV